MKPLKLLYHWLWAFCSAVWYGFPSRRLYVIGITGTKGKTSTVEMINVILEAAGEKTAVAGTMRFKIGEESQPNMLKMSMPGRGALQKFLRRAVKTGCTHAIIEMTSEGAKQFRHKFIALDALIFTNLAPEHIESHGSYEKYRAAKLSLVTALVSSRKPNKMIVVNGDDVEAERFLRAAASIQNKLVYHLNDWEKMPVSITLPLPGTFNKYNALAALTLTRALGIKPKIIKSALENFSEIKGRVQKIYASTAELKRKQNFDVIVDYAHTPDSLKQLLETFADYRKICVFGATGGGRDQWKRKVMGEILDKHCDQVIISTDDPYDEDPKKIADMVATGFTSTPPGRGKPEIILDRREAISSAIKSALRQARGNQQTTVLLVGKGTDPFIMGPRGQKTPWSDAIVAQEELDKILS